MREEPASRHDRALHPPSGVVMYVDNHDDARIATGTLLKAAGFTVRVAANAEAALAQADSLRNVLDVLIVDFNLGGEMTGTEFAESLARALGHAVPTIVLKGDHPNSEAPMLLDCPVWVAPNPISTLTLVAGLHPLVAFRRAMRRLTKP